MKYKVYPVLFILILLGFMSIFGGITEIDDDDCDDIHAPVSFGDSEMTSNGNKAIVKQNVSLNCEEEETSSCRPEKCMHSPFSAHHYNDNVTVSVLQNGSVVQTVSGEIEVSSYDISGDTLGVIENTFNFVSPGDYVLRYRIVCDGGVESEHDEPITITEGINGNFDLIGLAITCDATGNRFDFTSSHFIGTNEISIENTNFSLKLNMSAEIDTALYPCIIENSYEVDESGTFTTDGNKMTISYVDGSATVSQTFIFTYDGENLGMHYSEVGEDIVSMFFKKRTILAKR